MLGKKVEEPEVVICKPTSTAEELAELAKFTKRPAAAKTKLPAISGAGFLIAAGTTKLDGKCISSRHVNATSKLDILTFCPVAQKSHDKLAPLVAMPARSGRRILPELGRDLACEIQGKFSANYKPSSMGGGLDDRKREASKLLDEFDSAMVDLGKKRPKYSEYPRKSPDSPAPRPVEGAAPSPTPLSPATFPLAVRPMPLTRNKDAFKEQLKADEAARKTAEKQARKIAEEERNKPVRKRRKHSHINEGGIGTDALLFQVRSETRPDDPVEGAAWDVIGIVHIDVSANRTTSLLAGAVQQAGEYIMNLRGDMNRAKLELDQAEKDKDIAILDTLRKTLDLKKAVLFRTLEAANKFGDEAVLENLGGHAKLVTNLVNLLIGCVKASDFSGKLLKATLELMAKFRMSQKFATGDTFKNVLKRLGEKGDAEVKDLLETIKSRIKTETDAADGSPKKQAAASGTTAKTKSATKLGEGSTKRGREDEPDTRVVKKQAVEASATSQPSKLGTTAGAAKSMSKQRVPSSSGILPGKGSLPGKTRPIAKPAPKPDTSKADSSKTDSTTQATSEKPGVKSDARKITSKADVARPASALSSIGGGIASLLSTINAPKPDAKSAKDSDSEREKDRDREKEVVVKDETPEAKQKRLRKEARRKLRVSWAPESELTQIKYFTKDDDEEEGFEARLTKDAGDDKSEGLVLRQGNILEEDEDEEDDIPYRPWLEPTSADFSHIPADYRKKTYTTKGGDISVDSAEQKRISDREQKVLIAIYTNIDEIPPSPNSPLPESAPTNPEYKIGHLPRDDAKFEEVHRRQKETQQFGMDAALHYAIKRVHAKVDPATKVNSILDKLKATSAGAPLAPGPNSSYLSSANPLDPRPTAVSGVSTQEQVLALLNSDHVKQSAPTEPWNPATAKTQRRHDYPDPRVQSAVNVVEDIAASLFGKPYPPSEPPFWIQGNQDATKEWWIGYHKDAQARARKEADERARAEAAAQLALAHTNTGQQSAQEALAAYYAQHFAVLLQGGQAQVPQPPPPPPLAGAPAVNDNIQAVLAALGHGQPQTSVPLNASSYLHPNDPSYQQAMLLAQMSGQQQEPPRNDYDYDYAPPSNEAYSHEYSHDRERDKDQERDHDRDRDRDRDYGRDKERDRDRGRGRKTKGSGTLPPHRPVNKSLIGTKPCVFFKQGNCARGSECTFRHDRQD